MVNLTAVWLLTGLWHGSSWNFVLWGAWFLVLLLGEKYLWGGGLSRAPTPVGWLYAMLAAVLGWVLFRSPSLSYALNFLGAMVGRGGPVDGQVVYYVLEYWPEWIVALIAMLPVKVWLQSWLERRTNRLAGLALDWCPKFIALGLLGLSYLKLVTGSFNPFIYFQF